jgi:WD40 repeat protein
MLPSARRLKRAFVPHLMGVNEANGEPVRRTARQADLPEAARGLIERLINRRLLLVDRRVLGTVSQETVIEVAHEALLRRWPTLRRWHDQERTALETQQEIARAASAWNQNGCRADSDWLTHRGTRLEEAEAVARREDFAAVFAGVPRAYLDACRQFENAARNAEAQRLARQRTMQRRVGVLLMVVATITLVGGWLVIAGWRELERQTSRLIAGNAKEAFEAGYYDRAIRLALVASQGTWLALPSEDAVFQLRRAAKYSRLVAQLTGHEDKVMSAFFSPDGAHIVTASEDKTARVWSRGKDGTWASIVLEDPQGAIVSAFFSPSPGDARIVTTLLSGPARLWSQGKDGSWNSVVLKGHQRPIYSVSFSPDGTRIVTASEDKTARVWSRGKDGAWTSVALAHLGWVASASFSPDGASVVTASNDGTRVWSQGEDGTWASIVLNGAVGSAAFSPAGARIVTTLLSGPARLWSQGKDGAWTSVLLELDKGWIISTSFSPDGSHMVTTSSDGSAWVWSQRENGAWTSIALEGHQARVTSAAFSPDGGRIVTASEDKTARVWDQDRNGAWTSVALEGHQGSVLSAGFSPDGTRIVTASEDKTSRVWDVRWLIGRGDLMHLTKIEPLLLPETVCREKLHGSWTTVKDPKTGRNVERIAERLLTADDIKAAPILAGREGEDVCAPFLEPRHWWSRLAFWR